MTEPESTNHRRHDAPGALRSQATLEIQTRQAQRLVYGRRAEGGVQGIVGLLRFAALLRVIWSGSVNDDPYADWWLVQIEQELLAARETVAALRGEVDARLESAPAVNITLAQSLEPARVDLNFSNPYAFMAAYLLADFDALVRAVLTARHVGLLDRAGAERLLQEGGRSVRRAYNTAHGYRYLALTRDDVRQGTSKAIRARELLGDLPRAVLEGELRADHAPELRRREPEGSDAVSGPSGDEADPTDPGGASSAMAAAGRHV
ncbi:MAG TPA: TIGR03761 family integrating conjugative element protein [Thiohalobacter sp.]|nr:TIGR03761 family integrating conjugative element protein [Thiohalobacter sp.]